MSQNNPIRVFVTHSWEISDDYLRVFEYLESARTFFYSNLSLPDQARPSGKEAEREQLRREMAQAEVVIGLPNLYKNASELIVFELTFAKAADKPVVLLRSFGTAVALPQALTSLADEIVDWDERALVDALRRQARHEDSNRWDTIEFKLD
ncbi:MAG: hypothetical protein KDI32_05575 [Pseudomonadales bacterium]|nr:hypothetical protein [Pseudomonadales bacterium]